jgi:ribonuclease HIII
MAERRIGVDESGKGDFFGPLVIAAVYVGPEHYAELEGVKDSKKLKDETCLRLSEVIRKTCPHAIVTIGPAKYNELYDKIANLNTMLAWGHARAIENVLEQVDVDDVISDQFADPEGLKRHLMEKGRKVNLESRTKAESDLAVAAASVVARAEFIRRLKQLGEKAGVQLPKGANRNVVEAGAEIVRRLGKAALREVAKLHFRTLQDVLSTARRP